jgi:UDP-N-acetylmuramyl tripeptide synthase
VGEGAVAAGQVCLSIDPGAADRLAARHQVVVVSGTNGKTTTTRMIATAIARSGPVATNRTGANLRNGIVAALLDGRGRDTAVLEVDEALVPWAVDHLKPAVVVLLNLSRDQLDRYHETDAVSSLWHRSLGLHSDLAVVANADDPLVVHAASGARTTWVAAGSEWHLDSTVCPRCGDQILRHDGTWDCRGCEFTRPEPTVRREGDQIYANGQSIKLQLSLPGDGAKANAAMAFAALMVLGRDAVGAVALWADVDDIEGRYSRRLIGAHDVRLTLAKNPASWNDVLSIIDHDSTPVVIGLNAREQDGCDPSWIWDVPFEQLAGRPVVCVGERALDLSVRLHYASVECDVAVDLLEAIERCPDGPVEVVGNYTAFQDFRTALDRG